MGAFESLRILDFDHLEFAVSDIEKASEPYLRMGFERVGTRTISERKLRSCLMAQNQVQVLLSHSLDPSDPIARYVSKHGDGVCNVAFRCEDAVSALEIAAQRGAEIVDAPKTTQRDFGRVVQGSIKAFGDVRHSFISRDGALFAEGFEIPLKNAGAGSGLQKIDHITCNVESKQLAAWAGYYETVFGLRNTRDFDIHTSRSGLYSKVMESPNGVIKIPVNEPSDGAGQIQEFLDVHHGPGVQHVALATQDLLASLGRVRRSGISFLEAPPPSYYEALRTRVQNVAESIDDLARNAVLVDGGTHGYLLQIFTTNLVGPFFYEFIQRKGDNGFGEGNFQALFEAIERDQIRRGRL